MALLSLPLAVDPFPNWESDRVHSVAPADADEVFVCKVAQLALEICSATTPPVSLDAISAGHDPFFVRLRPGNCAAWLLNHASDSVAEADLDRWVTTTVLLVLDEPEDVVFAGSPEWATSEVPPTSVQRI